VLREKVLALNFREKRNLTPMTYVLTSIK
jgi:hypothetical protein